MEREKENASPAQKPSLLWGLLGTLFSAAAFWSLSKLSTPVNKPTDPLKDQDSTANERQCSQKVSPVPVRVAIESFPPSETPPQERKRENDKKKRLKWYVLGVNLLTLLAVSYYACITKRMWKEMQEQTCIQRKAGINTERAWLGLDALIQIDVLEIAPRLKVESHYSVKNFGHGPAFKVFPYGQFVDSSYDKFADIACNGPIAFATGTVPHGPQVINPGPMGYTLFTNQIHGETMGSPGDPWQGAGEPNLKHFWFIGCIAYIDQFKQVHWTRFCMEPSFSTTQPINKDTPLQFCALYNDTDDYNPPQKTK